MTLALLLCVLLAPTALGDELADAVGKSAYDAAAQGYLDGYLEAATLTGEDWSRGSAAIWEAQRAALPGVLRAAVKSGVALLAVALLYAVSRSARAGAGGEGLCPERLAACTAVCVLSVGDVTALMGLGRATLERMDEFSRLLLPTVTAACALTGQSASAAARQGAAVTFLSLLLSLERSLILPLVCASVGASAAAAALDNGALKRLAQLLRGAAGWALSLLLTGFVLSLSVTSAVASNTDAVARKAAKAALGSLVPVVGGILSDAAETLTAGAGVLRGTVGVVGLLAVLAICAGPFLRLGTHYLVYKAAAALAGTLEGDAVAQLIDALAGGFALMLGMTAGGGAILFAALVTSVGAAGG